ncbi:MAG: hypothetical protein WCL07_00240 [bacterium]
MATDIDLSERASESGKKVGRSVSINGIHAVDMTLEKSENLNDPMLNLNIQLNNPLGRLWLAIQRIWKSQSTVIALKFTIPLLVLPIAIYVGYRLWQGRGVSVPMSKLGIVHEVKVSGDPRDILVLPTSDVYMLEYGQDFVPATRMTEKPVVVIGTYNNLSNTLSVQAILAYNPADIPTSPITSYTQPTMWDTILKFVDQFR